MRCRRLLSVALVDGHGVERRFQRDEYALVITAAAALCVGNMYTSSGYMFEVAQMRCRQKYVHRRESVHGERVGLGNCMHCWTRD